MASKTSLYTRLDVDDDTATSASIMLAPDGSGTVMVACDGEPQFGVTADQLPALLRVLAECEQFRAQAQPVHLASAPTAAIIPCR
ncbi:hypothetical protein [Microbacterium xylanilyticum]